MNEDKNPVMTTAEAQVIDAIDNIVKQVADMKGLGHTTQCLVIEHLDIAARFMAANMVQRMEPNKAYYINVRNDERLGSESASDATVPSVTIADLKRRNELKVSSRGEQRCQDTPSKSEPGSTMPTSQSVNSSAPPNAKSAVSETKQKST